MQTLWGACESDKFLASVADDDCRTWILSIDKETAPIEGWSILPRENVSSILEQLNGLKITKPVTLFQFVIPDSSIEDVVRIAYNAIFCDKSSKNGFDVRVLEHFERQQ